MILPNSSFWSVVFTISLVLCLFFLLCEFFLSPGVLKFISFLRVFISNITGTLVSVTCTVVEPWSFGGEEGSSFANDTARITFTHSSGVNLRLFYSRGPDCASVGVCVNEHPRADMKSYPYSQVMFDLYPPTTRDQTLF